MARWNCSCKSWDWMSGPQSTFKNHGSPSTQKVCPPPASWCRYFQNPAYTSMQLARVCNI